MSEQVRVGVEDSVQSLREIIELSDLTPVVQTALGRQNIEVSDWLCQPLSGGTAQYNAGGLGVYRLSGTARNADGFHPWSLILKGSSGAAQSGKNDPTQLMYWKREVLALQSGLLNELPGSLSAPRCYGIVERPNDTFWLWLEDIQESSAPWTVARYGLAARHLGQFNGASLAGHPLLEGRPWFTQGRTRPWIEGLARFVERHQLNADTPIGRQLLPANCLDRALRLWADRQRLLQALDRLPICVCHHDAGRRNLLARDQKDGAAETVAIDWALIGFGRIGQDIGITTASSLWFLDADASWARELDEAVFTGYVAGLRDAGWEGDSRLARLGYTLTASLTIALQIAFWGMDVLQRPEGISFWESVLGHPIADILGQLEQVQPFLFDLGDEACELAQQLT